MALGSFLADAIKIAPAAIELFRGSKEAPGIKASRRAVQESQKYANALADPTNPLYRQILQQEEQMAREGFTSRIEDLIRANRRQAAMGRSPVFDAERGDEQIYRATQMGFMDAADTARERTRQNLASGYNAQRGIAQSYEPIADSERTLMDSNREGKLRGFNAISDLLGAWQNRNQTPAVTQAAVQFGQMPSQALMNKGMWRDPNTGAMIKYGQ